MIKRIALSLLSATLVAGCVSEQTYQTQVAATNKYQALSEQLSAQLGAANAQIETLQDQLKVTIVNELLFPEGGWELSAAGKATLAKIAPTLSSLPGQQIVVQGFTDNVPIGPALRERFPSNLELSTARADSVVDALVHDGVPAGTISAQGFGEERPVASNDTPQGRAQNRRVEIIIKDASLK